MVPVPSSLAGFDPDVGVLMTPRPITVSSEQPIEAAASLMNSCRVRHLPVVDIALAGILSLRDVAGAPDRALVAAAMTRKVEVVSPATPLSAACERMLVQRFSCLPVVENGRLVGIFTATDALGFAITALEGDKREDGGPTAAQLMTARPLVLADPTETLHSAWARMRSARVRHLPVMRGNTIAGILSDRDLLAAGRQWLGNAAAAGRRVMLVADAMSTRVSTIDGDSRALEGARTLLRRRIGALPVLHGGELRGMLTVTDFLYWIVAQA